MSKNVLWQQSNEKLYALTLMTNVNVTQVLARYNCDRLSIWNPIFNEDKFTEICKVYMHIKWSEKGVLLQWKPPLQGLTCISLVFTVYGRVVKTIPCIIVPYSWTIQYDRCAMGCVITLSCGVRRCAYGIYEIKMTLLNWCMWEVVWPIAYMYCNGFVDSDL